MVLIRSCWSKNMKIYIFREGWKSLLGGYRGGVEYPVSHFYKEILEVYPNAKVLLNVRDPEKWFVSVRDSILESMTVQNSWPCTWLSHILGLRENTRLIWDLSDPVPTSSSQGKDRKGFFPLNCLSYKRTWIIFCCQERERVSSEVLS